MSEQVTNPTIDRDEHDDNASAKRVSNLLWNGSGTTRQATPLLTKPYDRLIITYIDSTKTTISTIVSKLSGTTQETITNTSTSTVDDLQRS